MAEPYGNVIRRLRDARGWSQDDLVARTKISRETISRAENSGNVGVLFLQRIAHALDVDVSVFFGQESAPNPPTSIATIWHRLSTEQRADVLRYAGRLAGVRVHSGESE